jgi:hypothetical protein
MSVVTNVIVSGFAGCYPDSHRTVIDALNAFLSKPVTKTNPEPDPSDSLGDLVRVDQHAGGTRAMESFVWIGAFNGLPVPEFIAVYQAACAQIQGDSS